MTHSQYVIIGGGMTAILRCGPVEDRYGGWRNLSVEGAMNPNRGHHEWCVV
jgi:hypothetical protein